MRQKSRLRRLMVTVRTRSDQKVRHPRAAGQAHHRACLDYADYLQRRLSRPKTSSQDHQCIEQQLDKLQHVQPDELEQAAKPENE